ncbi:MAG: MarR family transcriptional regulator [Desulforhopalus sp.]|nr:MarR family transcriptional regulator [Desulforhopalus sp.]
MTKFLSHSARDSENRDNTYDIAESFPVLMMTCVKHLRESLNAHFIEAGQSVTTEQWLILTFLAHQDGVSQQQLADRYDRSKVSTMALLKKLEKNGLVIRRPDPGDGRSNLVYLTREGRTLQHSLIPLAKENTTRMSKNVSPEDIEQLKSTLKKITKNLKG